MNQIFQILIWTGIATLPTEILSQWRDWQALSPESAIAEVLWLPVTLYAQLHILSLLGKTRPKLAPATALPSAIGVELLLALRFFRVLLLWELPALVAFSLFGLETFGAKFIVAALALSGSVAPALWLLRRLCATPIVLWQGLNASQAIDESARLTLGKLKSVIIPLLLWNALAEVLGSLGLVSSTLNIVILPISLLISTVALAAAYRKLTL